MGYITELRKTVGRRMLIMPCAAVIIEDGQGRILLQKRADDGKWGFIGGAIEPDESAEDAARREVREELNLEMDELRLLGVYSGPAYHHVYPNGDETSCIDIVYICGRCRGDMRLQQEEVQAVAWFGRDDVPENLSSSAREPIQGYFALLSAKEKSPGQRADTVG